MEAIQDFEDILRLMETHKVKYLIIGGLAFIYHAKVKNRRAKSVKPGKP